MGNRKPSIYPAEYRDQMAKECHELLLENKTTVGRFAEERNISRKCLYNWIKSRYPDREEESAQASGFVKIAKPAAEMEIDYYGAKIHTSSADGLVQVLCAVRKASLI